jgi:hypothetical protein
MNSIEHVWGNKIGTPTQVKSKVKTHAAGHPRGKVGLSIWAHRQKKITFDTGTKYFIHSDS